MQKINSISLNVISKNCAKKMIAEFLNRGYKISHVYIDTVGMPDSYTKEMYEHFSAYKNMKFTI